MQNNFFKVLIDFYQIILFINFKGENQWLILMI